MTTRRLTIASGAALALTALLPWSLPGMEAARRIYERGAWWCLLGLLILATCKTLPDLAAMVRDRSAHFKGLAAPAAGLLALGGVLLVQRPMGFQSLEEVRLASVALSLHVDRWAAAATQGINAITYYQVTARDPAHAPLLQPFLVSLAHALTGFRTSNVFAINAALLFLILGMLYALGRKFEGWRAAALLLGALANVPLLARSVTGGGSGPLALGLGLCAILLGVEVLERPRARPGVAFVLVVVLLANAMSPAAGTLLAGAWTLALLRRRSGGAVPLPGWSALLPLLLLPVAWRLRIVGSGSPSLQRLMENLGELVQVLVFPGRAGDHSALVSAVGMFAFPFLALRSARALRRPGEAQPLDQVLAAFLLGHCLDVGLVLATSASLAEDPRMPALGLLLALWLSLAIVGSLRDLPRKPWTSPALGVLMVAGFFLVALPSMRRDGDPQGVAELAWKRKVAGKAVLGDCIILDSQPVIWTSQKFSAASLQQIMASPARARSLLHSRQFRAVLVCQRLERDFATGVWVLPPKEDLAPDLALEPLLEFRSSPFDRLRISRVRDGGGTASSRGGVEVREPFRGSPLETAAQSRAGFLKRHLEGLP